MKLYFNIPQLFYGQFKLGLYNTDISSKERIRNKKMTNSYITLHCLETLFANMRNGKYCGVADSKGNLIMGLINGIAREDGSGKKWIVTMATMGVSKTIFVHAV